MSGVEPLSAVASLFKGMYEQYSKMKDVDDALHKLVTHIGSIANTLEQASGKIVDTEAVSVLLGAGKELQDFLSKYQPSGGLKSTLKKSFMNFVKAGSNAGKIEEMSRTIDEALKRLNVSTSVEMCTVLYDLSGEFQKMQEMQEKMQQLMQKQFAELGDKISQIHVKGLDGEEESMQDLLELYPFPVREWVEERHGEDEDNEIERSVLGQGSYGKTLRMKGKAVGKMGGAVVAVKVISLRGVKQSLKMAKLSDVEAMVQTEIEVLAKLKHKHIVQYLGNYHITGSKEICIVMELASGGSLLNLITNPPQPKTRTVMVMEQLSQAVEYLHEQGVMHRDLKANNVLLSRTGAVKVIDFGFATVSLSSRAGSMLSARETLVGHENYRSPEMMEKQLYGKENDCWALGCMLTELLVGSQIGGPIYPQVNVLREDLLRQACKADLDLGDLSRKLLEYRPEERASATDVKCSLRELRKRLPLNDDVKAPSKEEDAGVLFDQVPAQVASTTSTMATTSITNLQFVLSGDLMSRKGLAIDKNLLESLVPDLISKGDTKAVDCLTSIEYVAAKAFAGGLHELLRELEHADALALRCGALQDVEGVRRFVGKHLKVLHESPTPSTAFQLALQEPDDMALCKAAMSHRQQFNPIEWLNKPKTLGPCVMRLDFDTVSTAVAFSPDGKLMASGVAEKVAVTDRVTGEVKSTLRGHSNVVTSVAFSPDGKTLASASWDKTVKLWDLTEEAPKDKGTLRGHSDFVYSVAFSPDGKTLASASCDNTVKLWDLTEETPKEKGTLRGHSGYVWSVAWSPDGSLLASGSSDQTVKLWDPTTMEEKGTLTGTIASWQHLDAETKALAAKVKEGGSAGNNRTGQYIVTADGNMVYVYTATSDGEKQGEPLACFRSPATVHAVSCRGTSVVVGCQDGQVLFLEAPLLAVG